jgi:hypothetical protein
MELRKWVVKENLLGSFQPSTSFEELATFLSDTVALQIVTWLSESTAAGDVAHNVEFHSHLALLHSFFGNYPEFLLSMAYVSAWHTKPTTMTCM